jgi:outer membrane protein assembly factor BamD (BamD/ComL family)
MKVTFSLVLALAAILLVSAPATRAQGARSGPDPATMRDPDLEKDSHHNLTVAKNYFKLKKAYVAALKRCEEIIAGNPNFAKIDEVLLMAGQSSLWLAEKKGKQSPDLYVIFENGEKRTLTPEQFREMGQGYLNKLITDFPESRFVNEARQELQALASNPKP